MDYAINPNLNNSNVINNQNLRSKIYSARNFIVNARMVGDLYSYIRRSIERANNYEEMQVDNLIAFEDIIEEFEHRFEYYLNDAEIRVTFAKKKIITMYF